MKVIDFWNGEVATETGHYFEDVMGYSYEALESGHDYIQWLLPKREPSMFRSEIPTLTDDEIELFSTDPVLKEKVDRVMHKMLDFYGMVLTHDGLVLWQLPKSEGGNRNNPKWWLGHFNHNYLRITRMLMSFRHLDKTEVAKAVYKLLLTDQDKYGQQTQWYWSEATYGPLP